MGDWKGWSNQPTRHCTLIEYDTSWSSKAAGWNEPSKHDEEHWQYVSITSPIRNERKALEHRTWTECTPAPSNTLTSNTNSELAVNDNPLFIRSLPSWK